ncbi:MAG: hypothetical protein FJ253_04615, partial [Phycisphaerae bacterium]|nr:hypothetical protein [Phycisphaerae bacterium]
MTRAPTARPSAERSQSAPRAPRPSAASTVDPVRVLRQNVWLLIGTIVGGCVLGVVLHYGLLFLYPLYMGEVRFLLKDQLGGGLDVMTQGDRPEDVVSRLAQTEAARLTSRGTLSVAVANPDVRRTKWAERFITDDGSFDAEEAVDYLEWELRGGHRRGQQIFFISWRAHEPGDVPVVLNSIADSYMVLRRKEDDQRFNQTNEVFRRQYQSLDQQIAELKKQMQQFVLERGLTSTEDEGDSRRMEEVRRLNEQIGEIRQEYDLIKARRDQVDQRLEGTLEPGPEDVREAENDMVLMNARRDLHDLKTRLASSKASFGPDHPEVRRNESLLEAAELNLKEKRDEIIHRNLRALHKEVSDRFEALSKALERATDEYAKRSKELETITGALTEMTNMKDRLRQLEEDRKAIQSKISEISTVRAREDAQALSIVQRATEPREIDFPKLKIMIPVVGLLTLAVMLGILFTREFLDQRVRYTSDLAGLPGGRILGVIPDAADDPAGVRDPRRVVRDQPESVLAEAYRQTAAQIAKGLDAGHKVIEVITPMPGGGASSVITNLAAVAQRMVGKVLVIDANFRRPEIASAMGGKDAAPGLADLLAGVGSLESSVQSLGGIDLLSAGTPENRIVERFATAKLDQVIADARRLYDVVLIDTPPAIVAGEVMTIANRVDATLLIVHAWNDQRG